MQLAKWAVNRTTGAVLTMFKQTFKYQVIKKIYNCKDDTHILRAVAFYLIIRWNIFFLYGHVWVYLLILKNFNIKNISHGSTTEKQRKKTSRERAKLVSCTMIKQVYAVLLVSKVLFFKMFLEVIKQAKQISRKSLSKRLRNLLQVV